MAASYQDYEKGTLLILLSLALLLVWWVWWMLFGKIADQYVGKWWTEKEMTRPLPRSCNL